MIDMRAALSALKPDLSTISTVFAGPVAAWLWAEAALFHGVPHQSTW
ncbi:hypothetical protein [Nocardia brasiliensis]|nr:hypothetical protein [Nocardia brasiliensis]